MAGNDQEQEVNRSNLNVDDLVNSYTEALPLESWLKVSVLEPERKTTTTLKITDSYVAYQVQTKIADKSKICKFWLEQDESGENETFKEEWFLWRRYSEFALLRDYLVTMYSSVVMPPLPEKRTTNAWQAAVVDRKDPEFIERRRIALEQFFKRLCSLKELSKDEVIFSFLRDQDGWKEVLNETNYQAKADGRLKSLSAGYRIKKVNEKFDQIKKYATQLETHVNNVLKTRAKTAEHLYGIHRIHSNYGREFSDWSAIEKPDIAEGLQKMGHYIDSFSQDIDVTLENEEDFSDQLKEYYGYCESLKALCKKQELLQLELEQATEFLEKQRTERTNLAEGKTGLLGGLKARVFGGAKPEQKDEKLKQLDEVILESEQKLSTLQVGYESFETKALANIDRWNKQKVADIHDLMINFIIMTIERCKKDRAIWANVKATCDAI